MELRLFIGAHLTGLEHMRAQLEANRPLLEQAGTLLPDRATAGQALSNALKAIRKKKATPQTGPNMIEHLTGGAECVRVLVIDPDISGSMLRPTKNGVFYPRGSATVAHLARQLEGVADIRLYFATRNPATMFPASYAASLKFQPKVSFEDYVRGVDPYSLRWSEYLERIQVGERALPVTTWSWEDYPRQWRECAQAFAGLPNKEELEDCGATFPPEISVAGALRLHALLAEAPERSGEEFDALFERVSEEFPASAGIAHEDIWPEELVRGLSEAYDDDLYYIDRMEGLVTIRPRVWA